MSLKLFLLISVSLFCFTSSYEMEGDVLVLSDQDFPSILDTNPYILIEFYAPWCGHCKSLAPVYALAATALKESGSEIKLAKVDSTVHKKMSSEYGVKGFPTLFFFINGTKIDYNGDRSKEGIIGWLNKKILPVTTQINSEEAYNALAKSDTVQVVLFTNVPAQIEAFQSLAVADDHNRYYTTVGDFANKESSGTVKLIRNFDEEGTFSGDFADLKKWIHKNSRPALLPFDQRTITTIFSEGKKAVVFINTGSDESVTIRTIVNTEAKSHSGEFVFTQIDNQNEHFNKLAEYIKVPVDQPKIILIDGGKQKKYILSGSIVAESISEFLKSVQAGEAKEYGLTDSISTSAPSTDEQL